MIIGLDQQDPNDPRRRQGGGGQQPAGRRAPQQEPPRYGQLTPEQRRGLRPDQVPRSYTRAEIEAFGRAYPRSNTHDNLAPHNHPRWDPEHVWRFDRFTNAQLEVLQPEDILRGIITRESNTPAGVYHILPTHRGGASGAYQVERSRWQSVMGRDYPQYAEAWMAPPGVQDDYKLREIRRDLFGPLYRGNRRRYALDHLAPADARGDSTAWPRRLRGTPDRHGYYRNPTDEEYDRFVLGVAMEWHYNIGNIRSVVSPAPGARFTDRAWAYRYMPYVAPHGDANPAHAWDPAKDGTPSFIRDEPDAVLRAQQLAALQRLRTEAAQVPHGPPPATAPARPAPPRTAPAAPNRARPPAAPPPTRPRPTAGLAPAGGAGMFGMFGMGGNPALLSLAMAFPGGAAPPVQTRPAPQPGPKPRPTIAQRGLSVLPEPKVRDIPRSVAGKAISLYGLPTGFLDAVFAGVKDATDTRKAVEEFRQNENDVGLTAQAFGQSFANSNRIASEMSYRFGMSASTSLQATALATRRAGEVRQAGRTEDVLTGYLQALVGHGRKPEDIIPLLQGDLTVHRQVFGTSLVPFGSQQESREVAAMARAGARIPTGAPLRRGTADRRRVDEENYKVRYGLRTQHALMLQMLGAGQDPNDRIADPAVRAAHQLFPDLPSLRGFDILGNTQSFGVPQTTDLMPGFPRLRTLNRGALTPRARNEAIDHLAETREDLALLQYVSSGEAGRTAPPASRPAARPAPRPAPAPAAPSGTVSPRQPTFHRGGVQAYDPPLSPASLSLGITQGFGGFSAGGAQPAASLGVSTWPGVQPVSPEALVQLPSVGGTSRPSSGPRPTPASLRQTAAGMQAMSMVPGVGPAMALAAPAVLAQADAMDRKLRDSANRMRILREEAQKFGVGVFEAMSKAVAGTQSFGSAMKGVLKSTGQAFAKDAVNTGVAMMLNPHMFDPKRQKADAAAGGGGGGGGGGAASSLAGLAGQGLTSLLSKAGMAAGPAGMVAGAALAIGGSLLGGLFGGKNKEREEEQFRAHLRALRQAQTEQLMNFTIVLPNGPINPNDPAWKEAVSNTMRSVAGTRTGRVEFQTRR